MLTLSSLTVVLRPARAIFTLRISYRRLKFEEPEFDPEKQNLRKSWLDFEHEQRHLSDNYHRKDDPDTLRQRRSLKSYVSTCGW